MHKAFFLVLLILCAGHVIAAERLDPEAVNGARPNSKNFSETKIEPAIVKAQILLDRAGFSPGEIDGKAGDNFQKALSAFAAQQGLPLTTQLNEEVWERLTATSAEPVLQSYTLSEEDVRGPFVKDIPKKMKDMSALSSLGYTTAREKVAERFHISEELLQALNPGKQFDSAGHNIVAPSNLAEDLPGKVARLEVDKSQGLVQAFDKDDKLLAVFPATVGSAEKPAPSGQLKIKGVSKNPTYRYNPDYAFKGVRATKPFTIRPGPNNPVGLVWIGLSPGDGFGIHGTPEPSKVSKTKSHGCVRLTNWDALRLMAALNKDAIVNFYGDEQGRENIRGRPPKQPRR